MCGLWCPRGEAASQSPERSQEYRFLLVELLIRCFHSQLHCRPPPSIPDSVCFLLLLRFGGMVRTPLTDNYYSMRSTPP